MANQAPGIQVVKDLSGNTVGIADPKGGVINPMQLSRTCKLYLPWVKDVSGNAIDKSSNGDGGKRGVSAAASTKGYLTSVVGTYGAGGTGRYYEVPAGNSNWDFATQSAIVHVGFNKPTPSTTENIFGTQHNSSTPGISIAVTSAGNLAFYYKPGNVQNQFGVIAGLTDGVDHTLTFAFDRLTRNCYLFIDGVLRDTRSNFDFTGATGTLQTLTLGGYSLNGAYDAKFFNAMIYAIPKDLTDVNVQQCVDKMNLYGLPLTTADLGM